MTESKTGPDAMKPSRPVSCHVLRAGDLFLVFLAHFVDFHSRDHRTQLFGGLEDRNGTSRNLDRRTSTRVTSHASLPVPDLERAETTHLDVLLLLQRLLNGVKERIDHACAVLFRDHRTCGAGDLSRDALNQVGFGHEISLGGSR